MSTKKERPITLDLIIRSLHITMESAANLLLVWQRGIPFALSYSLTNYTV